MADESASSRIEVAARMPFGIGESIQNRKNRELTRDLADGSLSVMSRLVEVQAPSSVQAPLVLTDSSMRRKNPAMIYV